MPSQRIDWEGIMGRARRAAARVGAPIHAWDVHDCWSQIARHVRGFADAPAAPAAPVAPGALTLDHADPLCWAAASRELTDVLQAALRPEDLPPPGLMRKVLDPLSYSYDELAARTEAVEDGTALRVQHDRNAEIWDPSKRRPTPTQGPPIGPRTSLIRPTKVLAMHTVKELNMDELQAARRYLLSMLIHEEDCMTAKLLRAAGKQQRIAANDPTIFSHDEEGLEHARFLVERNRLLCDAVTLHPDDFVMIAPRLKNADPIDDFDFVDRGVVGRFLGMRLQISTAVGQGEIFATTTSEYLSGSVQAILPFVEPYTLTDPETARELTEDEAREAVRGNWPEGCTPVPQADATLMVAKRKSFGFAAAELLHLMVGNVAGVAVPAFTD